MFVTVVLLLLFIRSVSHEAAAQLKLLVNAPERVWVCLEGRGYLEAAQHFLLTRHIYSQLGLGVGMAPREKVSAGLVQKMWKLVSPFKEAILEASQGEVVEGGRVRGGRKVRKMIEDCT